MPPNNSYGYTVLELIFVMAIMLILLMIGSVSFLPIKQKTSLTTSVQSLITDIKQQQLKSMSGEAGQGIYFGQTGYTTFRGLTYSSGNSTNFIIPYGDQINLSSTNFSGSQIVFATESGQIIGFQVNANQVILKNNFSKELRTILFNKYGTITSVQ